MASAGNLMGSSGVSRDDHVYREVRWLAVIIVPVLVVAFIMLYLFPQNSDQLFAWAIR